MKKYYKQIIVFGLLIVICIIGSSNSETKSEVELGKYTGLEVEVKEKKVTDTEVEDVMISELLAEEEDVEITNRPVRYGDTANIDYSGKVDGVAFDGGTDTGSELEIGSGSFIDGFEEQLIGMKIGETADIKVTFPDPYPNNEDLSGVEAVFTVKINSIMGKVIPEKITDDMVKKVSDTYTTVEEFRNYIRTELEEETKETNTQMKCSAVWQVVLKNATIKSLSSSKVTYYSQLYENDYKSYAEQFGVDMNTFIEEYMGMTRADFNAEKKSHAEKRTTDSAIAEYIAEKESISVTDAEYQKYIEEHEIESTDEKKFKEAVMDELLYNNVCEFLANKAIITIISE